MDTPAMFGDPALAVASQHISPGVDFLRRLPQRTQSRRGLKP